MKNVCIISRVPLFEAPYLNKYFNVIKKFDLIIWNRYEGINENCKKANRVFHYDEYAGLEYRTPAHKKILGYFCFSRYVKDIIKKNQYDILIFFDLPIPIMMYNYLEREYKGKYIIDIRDVRNYFTNRFMEIVERRLTNNSLAIVGTSPGHCRIVDEKEKFYILHNDQAILNTNFNKRRNERPIVISFVGIVRFYEEDLKIINILKNDPRYKLRFIGRNSEKYATFLKENNITNVELIGEFKPNEINKFFSNTNLVMNLYGNNSDNVRFALSNKLYFAARNKIPILVNSNTYMAKMVNKYNLGIVLDFSKDNVKEKIVKDYEKINWEMFDKRCAAFINMVEKDNALWSAMIEETCN